MTKYQPLTDHLAGQRTSQVQMSFDEIERVIGAKLPPSAGSHRAWWSNNPLNNVMTKAWLDAGFISEQVDLSARKLAFRRLATSSPKPDRSGPQRKTGAAQGQPGLFGCLRGTVSLGSGVDLTEPADPDWGGRVDRG